MPDLGANFTQGHVSSRAAADLRPGELVRSTGIYYKPGDTGRAWKVGGKTVFGDTSSAAGIVGLALCQFDDGGTDYLLALSDGTLYGAPGPAATGTFSSLRAGLDPLAYYLGFAHHNDRAYLCDGYDANLVLENDGTLRAMGLQAPATAPTVTLTSGASTTVRPTSTSGGFVNPTLAVDTDPIGTFAHGRLTAPGTVTHRFTWGAGHDAGRVYVQWRLAGFQLPSEPGSDSPGGGGSGGIGSTVQSGFRVRVQIEYTVNAGGATTTLLDRTFTSAMGASEGLQYPTDVVAASDGYIDFTMTYISGSSQATIQVYDIRHMTAPANVLYNTTEGVFYAFSKFNEDTGMEGPLGPPSARVDFTDDTGATLVLTAAADETDSAATHYRIYRTVDGNGTKFSDAQVTLGRIGQVKIGVTTSFVDTMDIGLTEQPTILPATVDITVTTAQGTGRRSFPRDTPPPKLQHMTSWKGSLVGVSRELPRSLFYSEADMPESWPEIYVITSFPMPERDELVATVGLGDTLLIAAKGLMMTLTALPRVIEGTFNASEASPLKGQPGCVGPGALCAYSVQGETRAAWVSPFGIHETNGSLSRRLTSDIDWPEELTESALDSAVLHWDQKRQCLIFAFDPDNLGYNNRVALLHMAPEHGKDNGSPKITWGHYGRISALASGVVEGTHRLYSGHGTDGVVYLEDSGGADISESYNGTIVPLDVETGRTYGDYRDIGIYRGALRHSDWGVDEECTVTVTMTRDSGSSQAVEKTVSLEDEKGTEFLVARSGERASVRIVHEGTGAGAIQDIRFVARQMGRAGRVAV